MSKAIDKLRGHPDYPNVSDEVMKEYEMERLMARKSFLITWTACTATA